MPFLDDAVDELGRTVSVGEAPTLGDQTSAGSARQDVSADSGR
jgi:hypothetical protein